MTHVYTSTFVVLMLGFVSQLFAQSVVYQEINTLESSTVELNVGCSYDLEVETEVCYADSFIFPDGTIITDIISQVVQTSNLQTVVNQCDSIITTTVNPHPYNYQFQSSFDICQGDVYTFPDGTVMTIPHHTEYTSVFQSLVTGCDSIIETILNTTDIDTSVSVSGNQLMSNQGNAGHQWVDCDDNYSHLNGQGSQTFVAPPPGNYAVIIYKGNCTDTSLCHQILAVGLNEIQSVEMGVYPNPTNGIVMLDLGKVYKQVTVSIFNLMGQQISSRFRDNAQVIRDEIVGPPGVYFLHISGEDDLNLTSRVLKE